VTTRSAALPAAPAGLFALASVSTVVALALMRRRPAVTVPA